MNKDIPQKEPIADSSHPVWKEAERLEKEMGWEKWLDFLIAFHERNDSEKK